MTLQSSKNLQSGERNLYVNRRMFVPVHFFISCPNCSNLYSDTSLPAEIDKKCKIICTLMLCSPFPPKVESFVIAVALRKAGGVCVHLCVRICVCICLLLFVVVVVVVVVVVG